jgi:hypothetical protein
MAYITKTKESVFQKASEMSVGQSLEGYYLGIEKGPKGYTSLRFQPKGSSQPIALNPAGNLNYFEKDTAAGVYQVGLMTRVTKVGERPSKKDPSAKVGVFRVEQDPEDSLIGTANFVAPVPAEAPSHLAEIQNKIKSLKANQA